MHCIPCRARDCAYLGASLQPMKTISPTELNSVLAASPDATVIDVRTPAEFASIHVPRAENVPLDVLDAGKLSKPGPVYILCQSGNRARRAADQLSAAGIAEPVVVEGGTKAWDEAGLPVVRGKGAISIERQVRIA